MRMPGRLVVSIAGALILASAGLSGNVSAQAAASGSVTITRPGYTAADVRFMQGMIAHHAQALAMTALLHSRTTRADMRLLAQRIEVSQKDEIALMRHWLETRNEPAPDPLAAQPAGDAAREPMAMPGMA